MPSGGLDRAGVHLANPAAAFRWWRLPADGVGLARMEFVVNNSIQVHPMALIKFDELTDEESIEKAAHCIRDVIHRNRATKRRRLGA